MDIPELLGTRSKMSIRHKASELGIRYELAWSQKEDSILKEKYGVTGPSIPESSDKVTVEQVRGRAQYLNLQPGSQDWTEEEDELLREKYPSCGSDIPELRESRTVSAIAHRAKRLGIKTSKASWSEDEVSLLRSKYPSLGTDIPELREKYTARQIQREAFALKIRFDRVGTSWTEEELQLVKENYEDCTALELTSKLPGRTTSAIYAHVHKHDGQKATAQKASWNNSDIFCVRKADDDWFYIVCQKCGRVFLREKSEVESFSHAAEGIAVPVGWHLPSHLVAMVDKCGHDRVENRDSVQEVL